MPTFDPDLAGVLLSLQRQIDQINTSRPGPMSWGARDGGIRFYAADGSTVLFQANSGGASVVSRGTLTSMTGLFDGIRDKNDNQDNVLADHREWLIGHNNQLTEHRGRLNGHDADITRIDGVNANQNNVLADHRQWIINAAESAADAKTEARAAQSSANAAQASANAAQSSANAAQSRADSAYSRASTGISNAATAQARADSAYSRAGTGISDAAAAHSRANAAYSLAQGRATQGQIDSLSSALNSARATVAQMDNWLRTHTGYPNSGA